MKQWRTNLGDARHALEKSQILQKEFYDRHRTDVQYAVGNRSLISKKHLSLPAERDVPWKLRALYDDPYDVTKVLTQTNGRAYAYQLNLPSNLARKGLHDVFSPDKLIKYRGQSGWPSQKEIAQETDTVEEQTEHVVERIWAHRDALPRGPAPAGGKRLIREYLVERRGSTRMDWDWLKVESLNRGGILGPWLDYEATIRCQDPAKATQLALDTVPLHTGGTNRGIGIQPATAASETSAAQRMSPTTQPNMHPQLHPRLTLHKSSLNSPPRQPKPNPKPHYPDDRSA
jgi:hypothetical protein